MSVLMHPHRLLVSGSSRLSAEAAFLLRELGRLLAAEDGLVVITGGLAHRADSPDAKPADRAIIDGVLEGLRLRGIQPEERIETFLPDEKKDWNPLRRFREGRVRMLFHRTPQARRFSMVHSADIVMTIEGESGTRSVLDVALAIERPILPLPTGGGTSAKVWSDFRSEICDWFAISEEEAAELERPLTDLSETEICILADRVHSCLLRGFTKSCFVIMPFDAELDPVYKEAICPALASHGLQPTRTDRLVLTGNLVEAIRDGLRHCFFAIADTTGDRPNVMYELGMAHAENKPVILLRRAADDGTLPAVPFDFQTESIYKYTANMVELRRYLEAAIAIIQGKVRSLDDV